MPCTCKQKVDRGQPKIQCSKCKELFHLKCVNLSEADADFFVKSDREFFCAVCTKVRRNSIRSPPPPCYTPDAMPPVEDQNFVFAHVLENQQSPSDPPVTQKLNNCQQNGKGVESSLTSVLKELAGLRAENGHILSLLRSLYEDKQVLLGKVDNLQTELLSMKRLFKNCCTAVNPVPMCADPNTGVISRAVNSTNSMTTTVPTFSASRSYTAPPRLQITSNAAADAPAAVTYAAAASASETLSPSVMPVVRNSSPLLLRPIVGSGVVAPSVNAKSVNNNLPSRIIAAQHKNSTLAPTDSAWVSVESKKSKHKKKQLRVVGSDENNELEVAVRFKWLHLSSFSPTVSTDDLIQYVKKYAGLDTKHILCYKLIKKETNADSLRHINFKLGVSEHNYDKLLKPEIWPVNVSIRPFNFLSKQVNQPPQN